MAPGATGNAREGSLLLDGAGEQQPARQLRAHYLAQSEHQWNERRSRRLGPLFRAKLRARRRWY
jgi:hypothetical protein